MNLRNEFERMMREQNEIALATMSDGLPHVRIVKLTAKPSTAFTTVPNNGTTEHIRARGYAVKSSRPLTEITDAIIEKTPRFQETVNAVGADLILYEIKLYEAMVMAARSDWGRIVF